VIPLLLLTPELRKLLKAPLGYLIAGPPEEALRELKRIVDREKPPMIITVGDVTSYHAYRKGLNPDVMIIDNTIERVPVTPFDIPAEKELTLKNLKGTISDNAWEVIREAMDNRENVKVIVEGEEDLLTLVAVLLAPTNSFVIYGQPQRGLVLVRATKNAKETFKSIIEKMEQVSNERLN